MSYEQGMLRGMTGDELGMLWGKTEGIWRDEKGSC